MIDNEKHVGVLSYKIHDKNCFFRETEMKQKKDSLLYCIAVYHINVCLVVIVQKLIGAEIF